MMITENRIFHYALMTSVTVHLFLLAVVWLTNIQYKKDIKEKTVEMVYHSEFLEEKREQGNKHIRSVKEKKKISLPKILSKPEASRPRPVHHSEKRPVKLDFPDKTVSRFKEFQGKRQVKIPVLDSGKVMGSHYMTYHEQVRDKIRNRAYFYVDDPDFQSGEVYLTFVLGSGGKLKEVKVVPEKTSANYYLKRVGLRSIKEAAPFPAFPRDLNYPELTFTVIISFEAGE